MPCPSQTSGFNVPNYVRGHANIRDTPRSGRPCTARSPDNEQRVSNLVVADKRVTVKELSLQVGIEEAKAGCSAIARQRTATCQSTDQIRKLGWTTLKHPPYSPGPCDYHLFGKLKESLRVTRFEDDDFLVHATKEWLRRVGPDFYRGGIQALVPRWRKAVERDGDYVEK
ncbi:hypothetical protein ANN_08503 [Periplaneta americana]|uniref:Histone-lysine N-methyltransferase SETMAR n=1 Tax=Periplaneta americana TaxID=6978 RepID=A0ABQ8T1K9_PERAM|nr:hypothetical protein ANN_08503 [Periplaneta americana]